MEFDLDKHLEDIDSHFMKAGIERKFLIALLQSLNPRWNVISIEISIGLGSHSEISIQVEVGNSGIISKWITLDKDTMEDNIELWKSM